LCDGTRGLHLLDFDERIVAVLKKVPNLPRVYADDSQQQLPGQAERQRSLRVDDGVCATHSAVSTDLSEWKTLCSVTNVK
jgi:hypothetical protein